LLFFLRIVSANGKKRSLGSGTYGEVFLMKDMKKASSSNEALVAVKIQLGRDDKYANLALAEAMTLRAISHPNIVTVMEAFLITQPRNNVQVCVVFEYCEEGDLHGYLKRMKGGQVHCGAEVLSSSLGSIIFAFMSQLTLILIMQLQKRMIGELALAVACIHTFRALHRDIKPRNVLVKRGGVLKLGDFGLAKVDQFILDPDFYSLPLFKFLPCRNWMRPRWRPPRQGHRYSWPPRLSLRRHTPEAPIFSRLVSIAILIIFGFRLI